MKNPNYLIQKEIRRKLKIRILYIVLSITIYQMEIFYFYQNRETSYYLKSIVITEKVFNLKIINIKNIN